MLKSGNIWRHTGSVSLSLTDLRSYKWTCWRFSLGLLYMLRIWALSVSVCRPDSLPLPFWTMIKIRLFFIFDYIHAHQWSPYHWRTMWNPFTPGIIATCSCSQNMTSKQADIFASLILQNQLLFCVITTWSHSSHSLLLHTQYPTLTHFSISVCSISRHPGDLKDIAQD